MIRLGDASESRVHVEYLFADSEAYDALPEEVRGIFGASYLETLWTGGEEQACTLLVGCGGALDERLQIAELGAKAAKEMQKTHRYRFCVDTSALPATHMAEALGDLVRGLFLGCYVPGSFKTEEKKENFEIILTGTTGAAAEESVARQKALCEGIAFARDMVNLPGNYLRPHDFARRIEDLVTPVGVHVTILEPDELKRLNMQALLGVGTSSVHPPCLVILGYTGNPGSSRITGLVGKGVTADTGGYCLKPSSDMLGIKGDMAGGAAVAGAVYALARNKVKVNVKAFIPMCENRISPGSLLPGDVIGSYAGKTIEIANTDAEGRLILADAVAYAVTEEHVTEVLDIATLTGAVVNMLGFSVAGVLCDDETLYHRFEHAYACSGERYQRIGFYREHEQMIESKIADIRNLTNKGCAMITAGLFIRAFANGLPWIHLDIAGTAWVDPPVFEFQSEGATGAGTSTIYYLCKNAERS